MVKKRKGKARHERTLSAAQGFTDNAAAVCRTCGNTNADTIKAELRVQMMATFNEDGSPKIIYAPNRGMMVSAMVPLRLIAHLECPCGNKGPSTDRFWMRRATEASKAKAA